MRVQNIIDAYRTLGCTAIYAKKLAENDNNKQQIYLGAGFDALTIIPFGTISTVSSLKKPIFKAPIQLFWMGEDRDLSLAPGAQLILYPQYPEVRLSGFVRRSKLAPAAALRPKLGGARKKKNEPDGRVLFFGIRDSAVICYLASAQSPLAEDFLQLSATLSAEGVFLRVDLGAIDTKVTLLATLARVCGPNKYYSRRLLSDGSEVPYLAQNGAGYTLEALLKIAPNGRPLPDYLDWEIKAHRNSKITLMTPEPDGGEYAELGVKHFLDKYRTSVREGTLRFASVHRHGTVNGRTGFQLSIRGYDAASMKIVDVDGGVELLRGDGLCVASWSFAKLIEHWGKKHASVAFIRYKKHTDDGVCYEYLQDIKLGIGAKFELFLDALSRGRVVYDPGLSGKIDAAVKARSQFRTSDKFLESLYQSLEVVRLPTSGR